MSELFQIDELHYKSTLLIKQVTPSDYDDYYCVVQNKLGLEKLAFKLIRNSKPDAPTDIIITNATPNSISLSWTLHFDGGNNLSNCRTATAEQTRQIDERFAKIQLLCFSVYLGEPSIFRVRYFAEERPSEQRTIEVSNGTRATISALQSNMFYVFSVQAYNVHGVSDYSTPVKGNTTTASGK